MLTIVAALAFIAPAGALDDDELYRALAFVTGTEEPERTRGFRDGFRQVVVKLTGDTGLENAPALAPYLARVKSFVASYDYEDRMKGLPVHDDQGTRQRPHFLRIKFDHAAIDRALAGLGATKWPAPRQRLAVLLAVRNAGADYVLTQAGEHGYGQREVLKSVSGKRGIPVLLPPENAYSPPDIRSAGDTQMRTMATRLGCDCALAGLLDIDRAGIYWDIRWRLVCGERDESWSLQGVSFDKALASGLEESAKLLSRTP